MDLPSKKAIAVKRDDIAEYKKRVWFSNAAANKITARRPKAIIIRLLKVLIVTSVLLTFDGAKII